MSEVIRLRRSALYVPASNAKAIAKARILPIDVVILDLEDAVAPEFKAAARGAALAAVTEGGFGAREVVIRVNALDTQWGAADLAAAASAGADAVLVPKVSSAADIDRYQGLMTGAPASVGLWVMIETCTAVMHLSEIAASVSRSRLRTLVLGTNDLAKEMRVRLTPGRAAFQAILSMSVVAARAHGLCVLDGVCNEFNDLNLFRGEVEQGASLGFDGKTLIHPNQIHACNDGFAPHPSEVAWSDAVINAFSLPEHAGKGVIRVEGKMAELLHLEEAKRLRAIADLIASKGQQP
jgi:citrate lyase subunit beta/citryl-CoA lyase